MIGPATVAIMKEPELREALDKLAFPLEWLVDFAREDLSFLLKAADEVVELGWSPSMTSLMAEDWEEEPPAPDQFLDDPYYLGFYGKTLYPMLREELEEILWDRSINEVFMVGSKRYGKTYMASGGIVYDICRTLCRRCPQEHFGAAEGTNMIFANLSVTGENAEGVLGNYILTWLKRSPWFNDRFYRGDKRRLKNAGLFPEKGVIYKAGNSSEFSILGGNLAGGALDEANFVVGSKRTRASIIRDLKNLAGNSPT